MQKSNQSLCKLKKVFVFMITIVPQVGTNGYFTFDGFTGFTPFRFARGNGLSLVAPFFIDIGDTTDASGTIKYEFNDNSTSEVAKSVNRIIRREIDPYFRGKQFLIASWEEVSPYSNPNNIVSWNFLSVLYCF